MYLNDRGTSDLNDGMGIGVDFAVRGGFVPADSSRPAFSLGGTIPLWTLFLIGEAESASDVLQVISLDGYATIPLHSSSHTAAIGAVGSMHHAMPYVQFGSRDANAPKSWYTSQAVLVVPEEEMYVWLPSLVFVDRSVLRGRALHTSFGFGAGKTRNSSFYMFSLGFGMEFFRINSRAR